MLVNLLRISLSKTLTSDDLPPHNYNIFIRVFMGSESRARRLFSSFKVNVSIVSIITVSFLKRRVSLLNPSTTYCAANRLFEYRTIGTSILQLRYEDLTNKL